MQRPIHCSKLQSPYLDVQAMLGKSSRAASRVQTLPVGNSIFCLGQFHPLCLESGFSKKKKNPPFPPLCHKAYNPGVGCLFVRDF